MTGGECDDRFRACVKELNRTFNAQKEAATQRRLAILTALTNNSRTTLESLRAFVRNFTDDTRGPRGSDGTWRSYRALYTNRIGGALW